MPLIKSLERIKRQKGWYELTLAGGASFPVNDELILKYRLKEGESPLPSTIKTVREEGEYLFLKKKAFEALSRRRLSESELKGKLKKVPKASKYIDRLTDELKKQKLIDDLAYAQAVIHTLQIGGSRSKKYISNKLYQKGVPKELAEMAIDEELDDYDEGEAALKIALKKYKSVKNLPLLKAKKRVADFLRGRGFGWDNINAALDKLFRESD